MSGEAFSHARRTKSEDFVPKWSKKCKPWYGVVEKVCQPETTYLTLRGKEACVRTAYLIIEGRPALAGFL